MRRIGAILGVAGLVLLGGSTLARSAPVVGDYDIVVAGGPAAVSDAVLDELRALTTGTVVRVGGTDRFATAAAISEGAYAPGVPVAYVATAADFADALVAGPVAALQGGPVLLAERDGVPGATRTELERLQPMRVVVLGGTAALSDAVVAELAAITGGPVERVWGPTRFATAAAVSASHFPAGVPVAYVATGLAFADALTVAPAGAVHGGPVLLATDTGLPAETRAELERLRPRRIVVVGGPAAVAPEVETALEAYTGGPVSRLWGATRIGTATAISEATFPHGAGIVFLATSQDFPDALALGAVAGAKPGNVFTSLHPTVAGDTPGPVLLSPPDGLPAEVRAELERLAQAAGAPVAEDQAVTTFEDTPVGITLTATGPGGPFTYAVDTPPADGTLSGAPPGLTYTPNASFVGTDSFTFTAARGGTVSAPATVTITVDPAPPDPAFQTVGNTVLEAGVAASGDPAVRVAATLLDGAPAGFTLASVDTAATAGTVAAQPDGTFTYRPPPGFTGADTFEYTLSDGSASAGSTVTVTVVGTVWYVDNSGPAGDGRSWAPFDALAAAEAAAGPGDVLFVHTGAGAYTGGITLAAGQRLVGEGAALTVAGHDLVAAGTKPAVDAASGDAITLASDVEVTGLDVTGAAGDGLVAGAIGGTVAVTGVDVSGASGSAVAIDGLTGTLTHSGAIGHTATTPVVTVVNLGGAAFVSLPAVTSAASGIDVSASGGTVDIASAALGSPGGRVTGDEALAVSGGAGVVTVGSLSGYVDGAAGIRLDAAGTVLVGGGSVDVTGGAAIDANDVTVDLTLASATSASSPGAGLRLATVGGTVALDGGAVSGATGDAILVDGGTVSLTAATGITNASQHALRVTGLVGGSVALSGPVSDTGEGIELATNPGSTVALTGQLDVTTTGSASFSATGGGTVTATGAGSALSASGASAVVVTSTTIGGAGLTFDSVSSSGAQHGIELDDTGAGPFTVAGDGSANRNGAGGTISGMAGHAVRLASTGPVTLRNMDLESNAGNAVRAESTGALTLAALTVQGNTADTVANRNSIYVRGAPSLLLADSLVRDSAHNQVDVEVSSGTATVTVERSTIRDNVVNNGIALWSRGTADVTLTVDQSTFIGTDATGVHTFAHDDASLALTVQGSTFTGNNIAVNAAAWEDATLGATISGNTVSSHASHLLNVTSHDRSTVDAVIESNVLDAQGSAGAAIRVINENGTMRARVDGNDLQDVDGLLGIRVDSRDEPIVGAATANLDLHLTGNTMAATGLFTFGFEVLSRNAAQVCAVITGNSPDHNGTGTDDLFVQQRDTAVYRVEGLTAGTQAAATTAAYLSSVNGGAVTNASGSFEGVGAGTCQDASP